MATALAKRHCSDRRSAVERNGCVPMHREHTGSPRFGRTHAAEDRDRFFEAQALQTFGQPPLQLDPGVPGCAAMHDQLVFL